MESFVDLESIYKHIENKALAYKYPFEIGRLFQKLRDLKHEENKLDEAEKAQWEIDFFNFVLKNGVIKPAFTGTNDKGEIVEYPNINRFNDKTYEYLIDRLNNAYNPLVKARYSHILWCSPKKHIKYAKKALESYLQLITLFEEKDKETHQEHFGLDVLQAIENAYSIGHRINYKLEKINSELKRLVIKFNFNSSSSFVLRATIINLMLKQKKRFLKKDFKSFEKICWRISKHLIKQGNIHAAIDMLELGEKVDHKLQKKTHLWRKRIAECYESLMKRAEKDESLVSLDFCQLAIRNYRKIDDRKRIRELENKYAELKNSIKLKEFRTEIDLTESIKLYREIARKIAQESSEEIIKTLMFDKNILPKYKDLEKIVEKNSKQFVAQHLFPTGIIDQSGHVAQHFSGDDEKKYFHILQQYGWEIQLNKIHLINEIIFTAIRENKLNAHAMLDFFSKHSWFGKSITKKLPNTRIAEHNWLNLLAPALHQYFLQMEYYCLNPTNYPDLVLPIDSLTLKIEGLFRDICQFSGIATFHMTKDNKGRDVVREKDIHALLYEKAIGKLFDEDDLLFLKFLLVEKAGYNLRHKIAHSLMLFHDYSIAYIHLLILALLRLGKYDFLKKEGG